VGRPTELEPTEVRFDAASSTTTEAIMTKDSKSTFPGSLRDHKDAVQAETKDISAKIDNAFQKLAKKLSERADKAKAKMDETKKPERRAVLLRRFELYSDAATHLREHLPKREG
jgi:ribosome-associated translation inhibitor RaiA